MLTDGLPAALDWSRAGRELSPKEWHRAVQPDAAGRRPLLLDCRNLYESEAGRIVDSAPPMPYQQYAGDDGAEAKDAGADRAAGKERGSKSSRPKTASRRRNEDK